MLTSLCVAMFGSTVAMERWSRHYRTAANELIIKTESVSATQCGFRLGSLKDGYLSRSSPLSWVSKWRQE